MPDLASNTFVIIRRIFIVALFTTLVGLILPGYVAFKQNVFDSQGMTERAKTVLSKKALEDINNKSLEDLDRKALKDFANDEQQREDAKQKLNSIDGQLLSTGQLTSEQVSTLLSERSAVERLVQRPPSIILIPFYLSPLMLLWVTSLTALAWLAFVFYPGKSALDIRHPGKVFLSSIILYVSYQWTVWIRYFALNRFGRKVIAFAHYDVSHAVFWVQELDTILFWLLLSLVCFQWLEYAETQVPQHSFDDESISVVTERVSRNFLKWQYTSLAH